MANPHRGEVALGDHTLVFSINAICDLEDALGRSITEIGTEMETGLSMRTLRAVIWAGLQERHPGTSEKQAGDIISEVGVPAAGEAVSAAFAAAFPQAEAEGKKARPRKGAA